MRKIDGHMWRAVAPRRIIEPTGAVGGSGEREPTGAVNDRRVSLLSEAERSEVEEALMLADEDVPCSAPGCGAGAIFLSMGRPWCSPQCAEPYVREMDEALGRSADSERSDAA